MTYTGIFLTALVVVGAFVGGWFLLEAIIRVFQDWGRSHE